MRKNSAKEPGIGSLSLPVAICGIMFSFTSLGNGEIGKVILDTLGIPIPYGLVSFILLSLSLFIGIKYRYHQFARAGRNLSLCFLLIMIALTIT